MTNINNSVTIYSTPTCHFCHAAKEFFKRNNIAFTDYDVSSDQAKRTEMLEKSGQMAVPVICVGDEMTVGFNESTLKQMLAIN